MQNKQTFQKLTITLPDELLKEFKNYCEEEGMNLSSRIAILIKKDLKKN
jgi:metal-responsive CopG/Arc/MetJ family transcriptional regulator